MNVRLAAVRLLAPTVPLHFVLIADPKTLVLQLMTPRERRDFFRLLDEGPEHDAGRDWQPGDDWSAERN